MHRYLLLVLGIGGLAIAFGCHPLGPVSPDAPDAPQRSPGSAWWTDCHDGWFCPPAYPQCPLPQSEGEGRRCEPQGQDFIVPVQKRRSSDGGYRTEYPEPRNWCDAIERARAEGSDGALCPSGQGKLELLDGSAVRCRCSVDVPIALPLPRGK